MNILDKLLYAHKLIGGTSEQQNVFLDSLYFKYSIQIGTTIDDEILRGFPEMNLAYNLLYSSTACIDLRDVKKSIFVKTGSLR